ncbi:hypothetical protein C2I36_12390 [Rhodobacteraceae bacterium WD3A24]|nr:hypothetical protein C2I36_12390 [Rhodobacteraceae bacterium WD3A24]
MADPRTWEEVEALEPTAPERQLIDACKAGEMCVLGDGTRPEGPDPARTIRAGILRYLILGGCDACRVHEHGLRLVGAYIPDALTLDFARANGPTLVGDSRVAQPISARQSSFRALNLSGSHCPGLNAQGAQVDGDVFLRTGPTDTPFHATGEVRLPGARIGGQLGCGGRIENAGGDALNAQRAEVSGGVFLQDDFHAMGEVSLSGARIGGQLDCEGGHFENEGRDALNAQGAKVAGDVFLRSGFHAAGEVSLSGARISGQLVCSSGRFENADGHALNAQVAEVTGGTFLSDDFHATGAVSLSGARIGTQLSCQRGRFDDAGGDALIAQKMRVEGSFIWRGVLVERGRVNLDGAHVSEMVDDLNSWPKGTGRLILDGFTYDRITGDQSDSGFTDAKRRLGWLEGGTVWKGEFFPQAYTQCAKVLREMGHDRDARDILVEQGRRVRKFARRRALQGPDGTPLTGRRWARAKVANGVRWGWDWLQHWVVGYGYKPMYSIWWLICLVLVGMGLAWAAWHEGSFAPRSDYLVAQDAWTDLADADNPAAAWLAETASGQGYERFYPGAYAFDVVVPVIEIGQDDAWRPMASAGTWGWLMWWMRWVLAVFGWVVIGLAAAAITGVIKRERE